jgi:hypothetical protein
VQQEVDELRDLDVVDGDLGLRKVRDDQGACRKVCQQAEKRADWHGFQAGFPSEGPIRSNYFRGHFQSLRQAPQESSLAFVAPREKSVPAPDPELDTARRAAVADWAMARIRGRV